ncbi:AraC family transcriptional regulator [Mucilaginibacter gilvus]|uniref:AraC family transcriptional regulator n=1 Tax=Mucilaginibacter gilvus TaxID=2305909 RepID=A0A444MR15_9SPHI|nr:AraC family transcriptional regulator [Mucilaginibacter gilvus]RWY54049.1 AraC family transcriptional regulator [Mucilaginibacter gilvus]
MNRSTDIYQRRINQVIDHLINNLDKSVSLDELASVAFFSPFHFHRVFVAMMGETVNAFTNRMRNEKTARLLRLSKKTIAEIATECGFSSTATLSRSFKKYFGVSPGQYRKGEKIKNSKIRKDLQPITEYHCDLTPEELEQLFPVRIKHLPERRIAYIRVTDAFKKGIVITAFAKLIDWSKEVGLYGSETIFGMSKDDPEVTPKEKYRYEACITLPKDFKMTADSPVQRTVLPACKYAFTKVSGDINLVAAGINYLFDYWLINSEYECETQPGLEVFLDRENVCNWSHFDLDIGIPVKAINNFKSKK